MTWGVDLWDQFDLVATHTNSGIEFVKKISRFVKGRIRIEAEYAKELRKLAKEFQTKKKYEDDLKYTCYKAFSDIVKETDDAAGQHELIAENLTSDIYKELQKLHTELEHEKRKHLNEAKKEQDDLEHSMKAMRASKKSFEKAKTEAEQALAAYQKAEQDVNLTKVQIEKFKGVHKEKGQAADKAKEEYKDQLHKTNNKQTLHYKTEMPAIFDELQKMDEQRTKRVGELFTEYSSIECKVMPILHSCLDNMKQISASIDGPKDALLFIEHHRTGLSPPEDIPFEEGAASHPSAALPGKKKKWKKSKDDFQSLNPGEKIRVCRKNIAQYEAEVSKLKASREGMEKLVGVYQSDPGMKEDVATVVQQLAEDAKKLDSIGEELFKYQSYLAALENKPVPEPPLKYSAPSAAQPPHAPDINAPAAAPPPPAPSLLVAPMEEEDIEDFDEDVHCRVLYEFQGTNDGEIAVMENEELLVLEMDTDNSGWTKVLKGDDEGFVPTAYIQLLD